MGFRCISWYESIRVSRCRRLGFTQQGGVLVSNENSNFWGIRRHNRYRSNTNKMERKHNNNNDDIGDNNWNKNERKEVVAGEVKKSPQTRREMGKKTKGGNKAPRIESIKHKLELN